ncbi:MIP family channel protein [Streptomyces zingiberis]|uniref:MIP family channel protein n=1 Tax=Streptomyces zingiberis TaxID=2053010 RepID=A0ABX1BWG7_9ACTN|nr:MIP family channel protein [Streptomyces zingiberis]NJQ01433.1 MIP family channel protein [Streptomyces zingiberis]
MDTRTAVSEFLGTLLLVFFGVGSVVIGAEYIGTVGIALAFGFTLLALAYTLGPVSGCHINPAVTLGMLIAGRIPRRTAIEFWVAQVLGAFFGALLLFILAKQVPGLGTSGAFGTNGYGTRSPVGVSIFGALLTECVLTFLLVYVILAVTRKGPAKGFDGLAMGVTLSVLMLVGVPLTGGSVNPARSIGPAIFAGTSALSQLWLFIVAPLVGGALAAVVHGLTHPRGGPREAGAGGEEAPGDASAGARSRER